MACIEIQDTGQNSQPPRHWEQVGRNSA